MSQTRSIRTDSQKKTADEGQRMPKIAEANKKSAMRLASEGSSRPVAVKLEIKVLEINLSEPVAFGRHATISPKLSGPRFGFRPSLSTSPTILATGRRGIQRINSDFQLDLNASSTDRLAQSYDLSASGTFDTVGFQIKQTGLTRSPENPSSTPSERRQQPSNTKKHLVKLEVLGRGASGVVHKALHVPSLLLVAVKVIPIFEYDKRHQLTAELTALYNNLAALPDAEAPETPRQSVACPELVCLYDAFMNPNEGNVSIVVEYMDGGSLQDIVDTGGCTNEVVLANIAFRVLKGLAFLHNTHQLHRDIKPSNLLINHFGDVKVSDFGIVRAMENSLAKATTFVGTLTYMSPERIASEEYSYKSDVWSFGLSIMTCALGKFPYSSRGGYWELLHMIRNEPPCHLPEGEFSDLFGDFLAKCLKKDQTERWSVKQLLEHGFIQRYCGNQPATRSPNSRQTLDEEGDTISVEDDGKVQAEVDGIVHKVAEHYFKDAKELINEHGYTLDDIVAWVQLLPTMQKGNLLRFAEQIGANRTMVCAKFEKAMNGLLTDIEKTYFDNANQQIRMSFATPAQVLKDVRFEERLADVEARLPATLESAKEGSLAKRNQTRRKLYHDSELIRIELEEHMNDLGIESQWLTASEMKDANAKLDAVRKQLKLDVLPVSSSPLEKIYMVVRMLTMVLVLVGWLSCVTILIPLKWLTPMLKKMGVKKNYLPMDIVSWGTAAMVCVTACTQVKAEGVENLLNLKDSVVCMFSHSSNLDGFIVNGSSPVAFKFAAKKSIFLVPFLGWSSRWGFDFVAIDRSHRKSALQSLKELAVSVNERGNSVCISPEGTRSKDGLLQDFKKGPFYLREDTKKNVVPSIVFGAYELWPPGRLFSIPGHTLVRYLHEYKSDPKLNRNQNRLALRRLYLKAFTENVPDYIGTRVSTNFILKNIFFHYLTWAITFKVTSWTVTCISYVCNSLNITYGMLMLFSLVMILAGEALMFFTC